MNKLLIFLLLSSCGSQIDFTNLKSNALDKSLGPSLESKEAIVSNLNIEQMNSNGFEIIVSLEGDSNKNSEVKFYFCNQTKNFNCDVMNESQVTLLTDDGVTFYKNILRADYGLERGDLIKYFISINDPDGSDSDVSLNNSFSYDYLTTIHRSVGIGETTPLATQGLSDPINTVSVSEGVATFQAALPVNVGVGDVIQYDSDDNTSIDAVLFISEIVSSTKYRLLNKNGRKPDDISNISNWQIFRSYTSLADAVLGNENSGLDDAIEDFESGNINLVSKNLNWKIAIYSNYNGPEVISSSIDLSGWITSKDHNLTIYTPYEESDVRSFKNRHDGKFDQYRYYLHINANQNAARGLILQSKNITVDGLQFFLENNTYADASVFYVGTDNAHDDFSHEYKNNILLANLTTTTQTDAANAIELNDFNHDGSEYRISNNYISGFKGSGCSGTNSANAIVTFSNSFIYNNTILDSGCAARFLKEGRNYRFINNLLVNSEGVENYLTYATGSGYNSSNTTSLGGDNDKGSEVILFTEKDVHDYRLSGQSYSSIGTAKDLSDDEFYPISKDIRGDDRQRWDLGASTAPTAIFRSIGVSNTSSLANGISNVLNITTNSDGHTLASFENPIPDNIGVGDAIQYTSGSSVGVNSIAFIQLRIDSQNFIVKNNLGENAIETSTDSSWDIYRAYTSIWSAENATENTAISDDVENFDTWSSGRDLITNNEQWNMALYADSTSDWVNIRNWYSDNFNTLRIFAPKESYNVGMSQRHNGVWDSTKSNITKSNGDIPIYFDEKLKGLIVEGLQLANNDIDSNNSGHALNYYFQQTEMFFVVKNNILVKGGATWWDACGIKTASINSRSRLYFYNNVIDGFGRGICLYAPNYNNSITVVDNNTIINSSNRSINLSDYGTNNAYIFRNNVTQRSAGADYAIGGMPDTLIANTNHSSDNTAFGANNIANLTVLFEDSSGGDYSLSASDASLINTGVNLSSDLYLRSDSDINGNPRGVWDLGAFAR